MNEREMIKGLGIVPNDRRRRIPVERAIKLYNRYNNWETVAQVLPGRFQAHSIINAVRVRDKGHAQGIVRYAGYDRGGDG